MSHAETRGRLLRLVGKRDKMASFSLCLNFEIILIYNYGGVVCCCQIYSQNISDSVFIVNQYQF